jgi:phosphohistidine phosphatase
VKTLLLLRHAKSSWDDTGLRDFDRPLAPRGRRDAPKMGRLLRTEDVELEHVVCSTAVRARETLDLAAKAARYNGSIDFVDAIYEAPYDRLARIVTSLPDRAAAVLMVGHNPGFEDLIRYLCSRDGSLNVTVPTATLACIDFDVARWESATGGTGSLRWLAIPKMIGD